MAAKQATRSRKAKVFPREPIDAVAEPLARFINIEASSGVVLLTLTVVAIALANSPVSEAFLDFWKTPITLAWGSHRFELSLLHWINDGLMVIFFFVVGLEIKREMVHGELNSVRTAMLPVAAAAGGMIAPAAIYLALTWNRPSVHGWGIPMATDIAFVVGCMAILGPRVPRKLRVMMLTLAIVDDIGAILVIAIGYTRDLDLVSLALAGGMMVVVSVAGRLGVRSILVYVILGGVMWFFLHESGVHATIGGVVLGLMTPARAYLSDRPFDALLDRLGEIVRGEWDGDDEVTEVQRLRNVAREAVPPSNYLESLLHPWVGFVVMPIFALANAGVRASLEDLRSPVAVAVIAGLVLGKPLGIVVASWLSVRTGIARLPDGVTWTMMLGAGALGGIGFTMALFLAGLALDGSLLDAAKIGVLTGSAISAALGMTLLWMACRLHGTRD